MRRSRSAQSAGGSVASCTPKRKGCRTGNLLARAENQPCRPTDRPEVHPDAAERGRGKLAEEAAAGKGETGEQPEQRRGEGDECELAELDADVEGDEREWHGVAGEPRTRERAREAEPVQ